MKRVEIMMKGLGNVEDEIFRKRKFREMQYQKGQKRAPHKKGQFMPQSHSVVAPLDKPPEAMSAAEFKERRKDERMDACNEAEKKLRTLLQITGVSATDSGKVEISNPWHTFKRPHEGDDSDAPPEKVCCYFKRSNSCFVFFLLFYIFFSPWGFTYCPKFSS